MAILNGETSRTDDQRARAAAYKEKIFGKTSLKAAPKEYWDIGLLLELNISLAAWREYDIDDKARILAHRYIKNMIEVIDAHYREQEEIRKRISKGGSNQGRS